LLLLLHHRHLLSIHLLLIYLLLICLLLLRSHLLLLSLLLSLLLLGQLSLLIGCLLSLLGLSSCCWLSWLCSCSEFCWFLPCCLTTCRVVIVTSISVRVMMLRPGA